MTTESATLELAASPSIQEESSPASLVRRGDLPPKLGGKVYVTAVGIGLVGLIVLLFGIRRPDSIIFDEWWYVPAAKSIIAGSLHMDPGEPPLGKIFIAVGIRLAGDNTFGWRVSDGVCGALSLVAIFLWTQLLFGEYKTSLYAAAFTLFNNFLFVMSRIGMLDIFLVFFLLCALLCYTAAFQLDVSAAKRRIFVACSGLSLGLAAACKWNAVDTLAALLTISLALPWISKLASAPATSALARFAGGLRRVGIPFLLFAFLVLPLFAYWAVYWTLYRALHLPFRFHDFVQINAAMYAYHVRDGFNPAILRHWYQWPFAISPMRFMSYLLGNPVVMWGGVLAILFCLWRSGKSLEVSEGMVALLYAANFLQWAVTPSRNAHYYYYFPAAMFLGVALAFAVHRLPTVFGVRVGVLVMAAAVVVFLWCYPNMAHLEAPWDCVFNCWI